MMDGKIIPTQMTMIPVDEPGESTSIQWKKIQFDLAINDDFFSLRKLQQ
jgi:outer membrane lipoprotein-sorting protein